MPEYILCRSDQLVEGRGRPARAAERSLAVFLVEGQVHIVDNQCLHVGSPLDQGPVVDGCVQCPWHGWVYDVRTGQLQTAFGPQPGLTTYECLVEDGLVKVVLDHPVED